jgi:hypothetical protein
MCLFYYWSHTPPPGCCTTWEVLCCWDAGFWRPAFLGWRSACCAYLEAGLACTCLPGLLLYTILPGWVPALPAADHTGLQEFRRFRLPTGSTAHLRYVPLPPRCCLEFLPFTVPLPRTFSRIPAVTVPFLPVAAMFTLCRPLGTYRVPVHYRTCLSWWAFCIPG